MECVLMVLTGVREDQIETCLSGLSLDEMDILVKYVYKGLGMPRNNGPLFKWHAKVSSSNCCQSRGCCRALNGLVADPLVSM